ARSFALHEYFDRTSNPVDKGFVLFAWGFTGDLPAGNLLGAQKKLEEAVRTLRPIGESFWQSMALMGLIMIDYLQLMEGGGDNRVQEISKITRSLKGLARELQVPLIALSQLSRSVEARNNKRPMMSDLRESGSIEQDADLIIMLYRDAYYNPDTPDRDITELIITKHRNGPTGVVKLVFDPGLTKFKNLARPMN
uniref:replicative DNA helicase n=1 Tax=Chamaesiphon sp. VAR_69_metabat_338 TaxID=2964704 RepID=UPI00286DE258